MAAVMMLILANFNNVQSLLKFTSINIIAAIFLDFTTFQNKGGLKAI